MVIADVEKTFRTYSNSTGNTSLVQNDYIHPSPHGRTEHTESALSARRPHRNTRQYQQLHIPIHIPLSEPPYNQRFPEPAPHLRLCHNNHNYSSTRVINEINIQSYASPDGAYDFNERLAQSREDNTKGYVSGRLKKDKITEFGELTANFTAEDWEGFQKLVSQSNIQDKDLILSVLSMYKDPEEREREIRNISTVFEQLAEEILPQLRYSRITASIDVIGKSDSEINKCFDNDPSKLSIEELLYAATLTDDNARRMSIYETATRQYPNDYRGWNDLGLTQYVARDYDKAKASFERAAQLAPAGAEPKLNLGLVEMVNGNYRAANQYFGNAAGAESLGDALGVYYLKQGDNASAVRAFGDSKSNNAALAQILTKDYTKAKSTLAGVNKPDATTYYLMAVLGARTNNEQMLTSNLRQAIKLDSSMAQRAANDLEFDAFNISGLTK